MRVVVIIPAYNEESAIAKVIADIPRDVAGEVVVVDNASDDGTAQAARAAGATVIKERRRGYGFACLCGIEHARSQGAEIVVFLDGDYSDFPQEMHELVAPIRNRVADLVIGSRTRGKTQRGALLPQARAGNWLACTLMRLIWRAPYSDLGPFRAVRMESLLRLQMQDGTFGWTIEMQIKGHLAGLRIAEVPVSYRRRIGTSKITGTVSGTVRAGIGILRTIGALAWRSRQLRREYRAASQLSKAEHPPPRVVPPPTQTERR